MVLDKIENSKIYECLSKNIAKAFEFIHKTDFSQIEPGKHVIDKENVFANVQEYTTEDEKNCQLEGHLKYIDIQYMVSGAEYIGITSYTGQKPINGGYKNDCAFFNEETTSIKLVTGKFAIFFPDDLHKPCIMIDKPMLVKKVVVKVRLDDEMKNCLRALSNAAVSE